nr:LuxR C-terminal-related transcriptional regulator [Dermacoccus sp. Tok2021]
MRSLRAIDSGEHVVSDSLSIELERGTWPGRRQGLTERESEVVALICQGMPNDIIAVHLHLTLNTLKSYIRTAYRKMGVTTRSEAVLWGVGYGFHMTPPSTPDTSAGCLTPRPIESSGNVTDSATPASPAETAR